MIVINTGRPIISRRAVLRAAGAAFTLPLLEAMHAGHARAATLIPKRFVVVFSPCGTIFPNWVPSGTETDFTVSPILDPLAVIQKDVLVVSGLFQQGGGGDGHQNGIGGMLTGQSLNPGPFQGGGSAGASGWANGISVDQRVAAALGSGTRLRSLELGVEVGSADNWGRMSYLGPDQPVPPEESPERAYARLFGVAGASSPEDMARLRARRRSVLDAVLGQFNSVRARVGSADRVRLDAHATIVRDIETRLDALAVPSPSCRDPGAPTLPAGGSTNDNFPAIGDLQIDLLALALACDLTRVASLQWSRSVSQTRFTWLPQPITDGHHDLSHLPDDDAQAVDKLTRINHWYAERFATLVAKLASAQEVDGSRLLDASLVLWCNELGKGNNHSRKMAPYVLAGQAGGAVRTGRFLSFTGDPPHNNLLVSILQAMDIAATTFGKAEWCTGPLSGFA
jgi:hypothetical protein